MDRKADFTIDFDKINPKTIKKIVIAVVIIAAAAILIFNCTYQVKEQEQAVLLTLGDASTVSESGLHFKIPFIQSVEKVDTTIKGFAMGYDEETDVTVEEEALMITSDYNFVNVDFYVEYTVSDPINYLYNSEDPVSILKNIAQSCIRTVIGSSEVDSVLTTGKSEIQSTIKEMITEKLQNNDIGIYLVNITIQDATPPTKEVMEAFKAVETAKQGKETALNNASKYRNEQIPEAEAKVDQILQKADAAKQEKINEAIGQSSRFEKLYAEYIKYPAVTKLRMFYETMEELLPSLKVVVDNGNGSTQTILPIDSLANINVSPSASTVTE